MSSRHAEKVAQVARQVREIANAPEPVHISKGGVHHVVPLPNDRRFQSRPIDLSGLREILEVDAHGRKCVAEPGVTFAELLAATLPKGLMPTVVPELEGITVGGAVAGCSVESMSFRYGGFHDSALEYEVVTGTGEVRTLSPEQDPDLFGMIHGSYGTLALLTRLTFRLIPAKPFVHMTYLKLPSFERFYEEMARLCAGDEYDFIDGIIHGPNECVLCLGRLCDTAPRVSSYRWLDIYYKSTRKLSEDYLTTADYCFRYDTECHWMTKTLPPLEWKPVRFAVGKLFLGSTNLIKWSGRLAPVLGLKKRPDVVVDVFIPERNFLEFCDWYDRDFDFYPLWVVPYRVPEPYPWLSADRTQKLGGGLMIDCAVYGKANNDPGVDYSEVLEHKTHELGGIKTLISRNHYSRERFWEIYNHENYEAAKAALDPNGMFRDLFEKFHKVE